jgi:CubicO group peptidase (beta-lactamase class C family)
MRSRGAAVITCALLAVAAALPGSAQAAQKQCGFPGSAWDRAAPEEVALDAGRLQEALDFATSRQSAAIAVYRHGCLVGEDRAAGVSADQRFQSFSMAKSVTAMVTGRAITLGYLSVDDPVGAFMPEADREHGAMTVRDLLTMSSGLHWNFYRDYNIFTRGDRVKDALTLPFDHRPGTWYEYHQSPVTLLAKVVERAVGRDFQEFAQEQLFAPIGIAPDAWSWGRDDAGNTFAFHDLMMRRDDYARLGFLMERRGVWNGRRLIADSWVRDATSPSKANAGYGYLFWLDCCKPYIAPTTQNRDVRDRRLIESLPEDLYAMIGFQEQRVAVSPGLDFMFVRLGVGGDRDQDVPSNVSTAASAEFEHELGRKLMRAVKDVQVPDPGPYAGQKGIQPDPDYGILRSSQEFQYLTSPAGTDVTLGPAGPSRARAMSILSYRLRPTRAGMLRVSVSCPRQPGRDCAGKLSLRVRVLKGRYDYAGGRRLAVASGSTAKVVIGLGRRVRKLLARRGRLSAFATAVNRDAAGGVRTEKGVRIGRPRS